MVQKSTCSNHNAVNMADVKMKKGCDATGVGMVVCARHGMRLPNGVADLQYGERYVISYTSGMVFFTGTNEQICKHGLCICVGDASLRCECA